MLRSNADQERPELLSIGSRPRCSVIACWLRRMKRAHSSATLYASPLGESDLSGGAAIPRRAPPPAEVPSAPRVVDAVLHLAVADVDDEVGAQPSVDRLLYGVPAKGSIRRSATRCRLA